MEQFIFKKKKRERIQGYSARVVLRGKSLAFVLPFKTVQESFVPDWYYQIGCNVEGQFPVLVVSKCGVKEERDDYVWQLKPTTTPKEGEQPSQYRFLLPYEEVSEVIRNRECPLGEYTQGDDYITFPLTREVPIRKKSEDLVIDIDDMDI